jgi:hypothetical protein
MIALVARLPTSFQADQQTDCERHGETPEEFFLVHPVSVVPGSVAPSRTGCQIHCSATPLYAARSILQHCAQHR